MDALGQLLLDPLFRLPFAAGFLISLGLALIGVLLMLRDEWLAALGLAHLAAAGALLGAAAGLPVLLGGVGCALVGGAFKTLVRARGNVIYGFMVLCGWSAMLLAAANSPAGEGLGHAVIDGQLYFAGPFDLAAALALVVAVAALGPWLIPRLLRARLLPRFESANRLPAWRWHLSMDLLAAASLGVGAVTLGVMGAFALVLAPAWVAFRVAPSWRWTLVIATVLGVSVYLAAFALALFLDQPFAPVLVALALLPAGLVALIAPRRHP